MSDLIQVVCIDDKDTNDKEWGALSEELSIKENNLYWGSYVNKGKKIIRPAYFIYETEDEDSLIGIFDADRFITLAEWRRNQIDNILDE
jgi:hypothetical protein